MPFPTNNSRPAIPYNPVQVLPNHNRYGALGKLPPKARQLDGDFNGIIDLINALAGAVNDTAAGIFPGAGNPLNANKLPTTDGSGNISWTKLTSLNLTDSLVQTHHIHEAAITRDKIHVRAVGTSQLDAETVTTDKIKASAVTLKKLGTDVIDRLNAIVPTDKIKDSAITLKKLGPDVVDRLNAIVPTEKMADNAVTAPKIANKAVTAPKVNSANASPGHVLTADGLGAASFLANKGRILQIVTYEDFSYIQGGEHDPAATPKNLVSFKTYPFRVEITPQKSHSTILIFYSINVGTASDQYAAVTLCKDDVPFKAGDDNINPSYSGVTHGLYNPTGFNQSRQRHASGQWGCFNFSSLFVDTGVLGRKIVYEIKKARPYTAINSGRSGGDNSMSIIHAIEVDI